MLPSFLQLTVGNTKMCECGGLYRILKLTNKQTNIHMHTLPHKNTQGGDLIRLILSPMKGMWANNVVGIHVCTVATNELIYSMGSKEDL